MISTMNFLWHSVPNRLILQLAVLYLLIKVEKILD